MVVPCSPLVVVAPLFLTYLEVEVEHPLFPAIFHSGGLVEVFLEYLLGQTYGLEMVEVVLHYFLKVFVVFLGVSGHQFQVLFGVLVTEFQELKLNLLLVLYSVLTDLQGQKQGSSQCRMTLQDQQQESFLYMIVMGFVSLLLSLSLDGFSLEQVGLPFLGVCGDH